MSRKKLWKGGLVLLCLVGIALSCAAGEVFINDLGEVARGFRIKFSQPVEIIDFGGPFLSQYPSGQATEFIFSDGEAQPWDSLWLSWSPASATVMEHHWLTVEPRIEKTEGGLLITGSAYRLRIRQDSPFYDCEFALEVKDGQGEWNAVQLDGQAEFAYVEKGEASSSLGLGARCTFKYELHKDAVVVGMSVLFNLLNPLKRVMAEIHLIGTDDGVLVRFATPQQQKGQERDAVFWTLPRFSLDNQLFDAYTFWGAPDELHTGTIAELGESSAYGPFAGVSPWGREGDTTDRLSALHPALIVRSEKRDTGFGTVFMNYERDWAKSYSFFQHYRSIYFNYYSGFTPVPALKPTQWAWLTPFAGRNAAVNAQKVEMLLHEGEALMKDFKPIAPKLSGEILQPIKDFPAELRCKQPVTDINNAVVYTINDPTLPDYGISLAKKVGSDMLIRGWFKWHNARNYQDDAHVVPKAYALGALFGGGTTCSALYYGENNLSKAQVLDMATRGPDGNLVNAWGRPGILHGTLSNPKYINYILSWCFAQIDAGVDHLFMDEINAALSEKEGYDDYSIHDFRNHLRHKYCDGQGWAKDDPRWGEKFKIDLTDKAVAPDGTIESFNYRAYLKKYGFTKRPTSDQNPLAVEWQQFRQERDERAWETMTDRIREYARKKGRRVYISANGLAKYVDLQVVGIRPGHCWRLKNGKVDLSGSQLHEWESIVHAGRSLAGKRVPVVLFHDWGWGFPWTEVTPAERNLWMRVRGAEIYAAGGFFAFPVRSPYRPDSLHDDTIREIQRQTIFYQKHKELYLQAECCSVDCLPTMQPSIGTALWRSEESRSLLVHVINRMVDGMTLKKRKEVTVEVPTHILPTRVRIVSPDWNGEKPGRAEQTEEGIRIMIPELEAYAIAILDYSDQKTLPALFFGPLLVPERSWERPEQNEFPVDEHGWVANLYALNGILQGRYHPHLRNPPTFLVHAKGPARISMKIQSVAQSGAKLEYLIDGKLTRSLNLPDRDGKNDLSAPEYDQVFEFDIPPGRHRITLQNVGGDWATVAWYQFSGPLAEWAE